MKHYLNNLKAEGDKLQMTPAEKQAMRARVMSAVGAQPSPISIQKTPYFGWFIGPRAFAPAFAVLLLVGVSTASAAQGSLPGDLLYPVKISINEQIESVLAVGAEAKANLHADLANRRLEEAQSLAVVGKLDATAAEVLETNFNAHAEVAETLTAQIEPQNPAVATEIKTKLATAISTQGAILATLGDTSVDVSTQQNSRAINARVIARSDKNFAVSRSANIAAFEAPAAKQAPAQDAIEPMSLRVAVEPPVAAMEATVAPDPTQQKVAAELQEKAATLIATARKQLKALSVELDATTTARVELQFAEADKLMSSGSMHLKEGDTFGASSDFTSAIQIAVKVSAVLKAQEKFDKDVITPILNGIIEASPLIITPEEKGNLVPFDIKIN